jgi:hypothetical protein
VVWRPDKRRQLKIVPASHPAVAREIGQKRDAQPLLHHRHEGGQARGREGAAFVQADTPGMLDNACCCKQCPRSSSRSSRPSRSGPSDHATGWPVDAPAGWPARNHPRRADTSRSAAAGHGAARSGSGRAAPRPTPPPDPRSVPRADRPAGRGGAPGSSAGHGATGTARPSGSRPGAGSSRPPRPRPSPASKSPTRARMSRARSARSRPTGVIRTECVDRSATCTPNRASISFSPVERVDWVTWHSSAAREKFPVSASATRKRICRSVVIGYRKTRLPSVDVNQFPRYRQVRSLPREHHQPHNGVPPDERHHPHPAPPPCPA